MSDDDSPGSMMIFTYIRKNLGVVAYKVTKLLDFFLNARAEGAKGNLGPTKKLLLNCPGRG